MEYMCPLLKGGAGLTTQGHQGDTSIYPDSRERAESVNGDPHHGNCRREKLR